MAIVFLDSFDHYAYGDLTEKWTQIIAASPGNTDATTIAAVGRHGSNGLKMSTSASGLLGQGPAMLLQPSSPAPSGATWICGLAINAQTPFTRLTESADERFDAILARVRHGSTTQVYFRLNKTGTISAYRGTTSPTLLGTTSVALQVGVYAHVEMTVVLHSSTGSVKVRINNNLVLNLTGVNTQHTGSALWDGFGIGPIGTDGVSTIGVSEWDLDDVYLLDGSGAAPWNAGLGDCRVDVRLPTGAGATTQWTASTGANWQNVDDSVPDDDSTYNSNTTVNQIDTFVYQDAPVPGATLYGIQHCLNLKKMDAGTCQVGAVVRHGGTHYVGADLFPSTAYGYLRSINATNPGTSAAWTEVGFNAAEFGVKRTA